MDNNNNERDEIPAEEADSTPKQPEKKQPTNAVEPKNTPEVEWHASEYIHHEKGMMWFVVLAGITVLGAGVALLLQQWSFAVLIVVMGVALGFFANRPPREIHYQIGRDGVSVGAKTFPFSQFRAFGVLSEGAFYSIRLRPTKRFAPSVSLIFAESEGEKIFDALAARLPAEEVRQDPIEELMRKLRF